MLELTETLALTLGRIHPNVAHIVDIIDGNIRIHGATTGVNQNHTVAHLRKIKLADHAFRHLDVADVLLPSLLRIRPRHHRKLLRLGGILRKKSDKSLDGEIQALTVRITIAVQEHDRILGDIDLRTKCSPVGKRTEDLDIGCMFKNTNLCLRVATELTLVDLGPLRRERLDRLASLIDTIQKRLGNSKVHLVQLCPNLEVGLLWILLDCVQELVDNERIILENHKLRVDSVNLLAKLVEPKSLLTRLLGRRGILGNDPIGNLAMIGTTGVALKSKVKDLELRTECRHLAEEIVGHLGLSSGLIHMCAHKKDPH